MGTDRIAGMIVAVAIASLGAGLSLARAGVGPTAMVADPCAGAVQQPLNESLRLMLQPGGHMKPPSPEEAAAAGKAMAEQRVKDWPDLCRYPAANAAVKHPPKVVFMGDSITELWKIADPGFFSNDRVDRGISGQTSPQMLLRFRSDVVDLKPRTVHILAGTNDIAGNTGPTNEKAFKDNIESMVELAKTHHIHVVLASILPMGSIGWQPQYRPAEEVRQLNRWLRDYAARSGVIWTTIAISPRRTGRSGPISPTTASTPIWRATRSWARWRPRPWPRTSRKPPRQTAAAPAAAAVSSR